MPDVAAKAAPSIQATAVIRPGAAPDMPARLRSSTTARVWSPRWVKRKKATRPRPAAMATATTRVWSTPTFTSNSR